MRLITAGVDGASARLIAAARAIQLAGDRILPRATAKEVLNLARATRSSLEAGEQELALAMLDDILALLDGAEEIAIDVLRRRVASVRGPIAFQPSRGA